MFTIGEWARWPNEQLARSPNGLGSAGSNAPLAGYQWLNHGFSLESNYEEIFIYAWPIPPDVYFRLSNRLEVLMIAEWVMPTGLGSSTSNTP